MFHFGRALPDVVDHVRVTGQLTEAALVGLLEPLGIPVGDLGVRDPALPPLANFHPFRRTALILNNKQFVADELERRRLKQEEVDAIAARQEAAAIAKAARDLEKTASAERIAKKKADAESTVRQQLIFALSLTHSLSLCHTCSPYSP